VLKEDILQQRLLEAQRLLSTAFEVKDVFRNQGKVLVLQGILDDLRDISLEENK
jgi:hypothetical protein